MSSPEQIFGGYYIKARKIKDSEVAHAAPHVREIWDFLIREANHKPYKANGKTINRGQLFTSFQEIQDELHWWDGFVKRVYKKHQVDNALRWLRQRLMVTTDKTTRGLIVTICNYESYQNPKNYGNDIGYDNATTPLRQPPDTIYKNDNNVNNENINRGTGDFASPVDPATIPGFKYLPNDKSYIEPTFLFTKADFNGLPDEKNEAVRKALLSVKQIEVEPETVKTLWESFKELELTFQKPYRNKDGVYKHFSNWMNTRPFKKQAAPKLPKTKKQTQVIGVEYLNDFKECKMSDGTIISLDQNQQDSAKYSGIKPSSIKK